MNKKININKLDKWVLWCKRRLESGGHTVSYEMYLQNNFEKESNFSILRTAFKACLVDIKVYFLTKIKNILVNVDEFLRKQLSK